MGIFRLQHTSIPMPIGGNEEARRFYSGVLGLREIPPPATLQVERLVWFSLSNDGDELHLIAEEGFAPSQNHQHLCMVVDDIAAVRAMLQEANVEIGVEREIPTRPRLSFRDPFGNKVELTEIHGNYLDAQS